jgi:lipoic acid synthetase
LCKVEVLIPDFYRDRQALVKVLDAAPDTLNHNIETVRRIFRRVRPKGDYDRSLELLYRAKAIAPGAVTKSGMMVGLGETWDEIIETMRDLRTVNCDLLTIGQYIRPSDKHIALSKWYSPKEFTELSCEGKRMGFRHVASGPLVRSSYHADDQHAAATNAAAV